MADAAEVEVREGAEDVRDALERRLGRLYARQRLGIEDEREARVFGRGLNYFHPENWYFSPPIVRTALRLSGLYWRARNNAARIEVRGNDIAVAALPRAFDGYTILHLSDLHVDLNPAAMQRLSELLPQACYDLCVLTGDYRGKTHGPYAAALDGMRRLMTCLEGPVYGVLGNHDSIRMVPALEAMGIRMLLNEAAALVRDGERVHLAGIDDAHYYRVDNIEKAAEQIPEDAVSILLSHTPEIFRQAAHAGFDVLLSGHTHGGQICLPGAIPLTLDSKLPRRFGSGAWRYQRMAGYTSVGAGSCIVPARINCPPEITLHRLRRAAP
jgi:predicted MPP superfamily phosphohydrolase